MTRVTEPIAGKQAAGSPSAGSTGDVMLRWAVRLILAQAVVLAAVTAFLAYASVRSQASTVRVELSVTGYALLITALLALVGIALLRRRRWARGPAIVLELLQVPIALGMLTGGMPAIGVPVLLVSATAAGLLLAPSTRLALARR